MLFLTTLKMKFVQNKIVKVIYRNYKNITEERCIQPIKLWYGYNEYHLKNQWLLKCFDVKRGVYRDFAMKDIQSWKSFKN